MQKALAPEISTWPDENPQLIGSQCGELWRHDVPRQERCPRCSAGGMSEVPLPRRGTWWPGPPRASRPERPTPVRPARISSRSGWAWFSSATWCASRARLTENDPEKLKWGMDVELTMVPFATDADGNEIVTFAFQPV